MNARRVSLATIASVCSLIAGLSLSISAEPAGAMATVGVSPEPGATGLPDGRLYEEATPAYKNGNFVDFINRFGFGLATADGNAVVYPLSGAAGTSYAGMASNYVSRRSPGSGWSTSAVLPRPQEQISIFAGPTTLVPSSDFTRFLFTSQAAYVKGDSSKAVNIFLSGDSAVEPAWLGAPRISNPFPAVGEVNSSSHEYLVAGATPDLGTVYFAYGGTLTSEDASRAPHVLMTGETLRDDDPWGFYEWSAGQLISAGTLPDGKLNPFGAVPAAIAGQGEFDRKLGAFQAQVFDNEVSENGSRVFFVSPDPGASTVTNASECSSEPPCTSEPPELYVRETVPGGAHNVVLVSRSVLAGHEGEPAPDGVRSVASAPDLFLGQEDGATDAFASPDGSHVLFASTDRLTQAAPENGEVKEYDFDIDTQELTYLPGVVGPIATSTRNGSELLFENTATTPRELDLWSGGPNGGTVTSIAQLPQTERSGNGLEPNVNESHVSGDGSVFVFQTHAQVPGGFNNGGGFEQIYRYVVATQGLTCLSCPPAGVVPSGDARMSYNNWTEGVTNNGGNSDPATTIETRGISAGGDRVFFDSPDPLVPQDTNGKRDVYEWENGKLYLISSGTGSEESFYLDSSESGGDVFFTTSVGLVPGDADGAYDVYDARMPRPGDNPPPFAVPCKGSVCQGPPSVPQLLGLPASETFSGAGNLALAPQGSVRARGLTNAQKLARALKACRADRSKRKRGQCEARARKQYGGAHKSIKSNRRGK